MARVWRIGRWILLGLLVLPIALWLGGSVVLKLTVLKDESYGRIVGVVGSALWANVSCTVVGCEPEVLEGMESIVFDETLLGDTPVALEIDEHGRVLVAETLRQNKGTEDNRSHDYWLEDDLASRTIEDRVAYYEKWIREGEIEDADHFTRHDDRLVRLVDTDGDGVADERNVLATWNEAASGLVSGVEAREGTIWVTSIPSLYRIEDQDGDGSAESVEEIHRGFGVKTSLIGHDLHGMVWGPDGKLYFSMGDRGYSVTTREGELLRPALGPGRGAVFRMNADGSDLEVFATGVRNPQELAFDDHGNLFTGDNNGDGGDAARVVYLVEGGETGWAMPYQTLIAEYVRGPWVAERLWELQHETQPAWVLPPVAHIANGPAGFAHYPGLGLPERYDDSFFLCDYGYTRGRSGIWSFKLEPDGAGMQMVDRHKFAWSVLATDFDFSWDGRMFASIFDTFGQARSIIEWRHPASREDPRVAELANLAKRRMATLETEELLSALRFPDQRLRLRAQYELAERRSFDDLNALLRDQNAPLVPRLHALWGLGQNEGAGLSTVLADGTGWLASEGVELRAQLARVAGEAGRTELAPLFVEWLTDPSLRVRFFAAQALGALGHHEAIGPLFDALAANADQDVFLRHAIVWALHRLGAANEAFARSGHADRAVRMGALLVLRNADDPRIEGFLDDEDPLLVVEAARAIYDRPIDGAMVALAALASGIAPAAEDDAQTSQALHRRVIGANVRLRSAEGAAALATYAGDEAQLESLRVLALEALGDYTRPPVRDLTMGFYRPLGEIDEGILAAVFASQGRALIDSSLGARAMEIANEIGELPLSDEELLELVRGPGSSAPERAAAFRALTQRAAEGTLAPALSLEDAIESGTSAADASIRTAARELELIADPASGLESLVRAAEQGGELLDRKHAYRLLGDRDEALATEAVARALARYSEGSLEPAVALEVLIAAKAQEGALAASATALLAPGVSASAETLVEERAWALAGGDPVRGEAVFQTVGDCQRCHGGEAGHGGGAGPSLAGIGQRGARYVLESVLAPAEEIASGFGTVVVERRDGTSVSGLLLEEEEDAIRLDLGGESPVRVARSEIESVSPPTTGMPPMGLTLTPDRLRDVIAYVMTLESAEPSGEEESR